VQQPDPNTNFLATIRDLFRQLDGTMLADRPYLRRDLRIARNLTLDGRTSGVPTILQRITDSLLQSLARVQHRRSAAPRIAYPDDLPVALRAPEIAAAIRQHQVVIICGATGSGKTTQLPKVCLELGRGIHGMIGHTQPRRIAARSVARRIADELNTNVGGHSGLVGYKVRFSDHVSPASLIKLITDGILLAEIQSDRLLWQYDTIILDEAHERSLNIDFLIGYLRHLLPRRPDLKLIITSATIAPERFSEHFDGAPIINVEGRMYPVDLRYRPFDVDNPDEQDLQQDRAILSAVDELFQQGPGDTLIFLPGERDIRNTTELLRKHHPRHVDILPLYARLSADEQMRVFAPHDRPRLILTTNIAETSLTVPGVKYVIDLGLARISRYGGRGSVQRLPIEPISQASANQRSGRSGRTCPGVCIRLYSEEAFTKRPEFTDPEIRRTNLASVILQMKSLRLGRIEDFPFLDPPDYRQIRDGYQTLHELGAIDEQNELTDLGRLLARLPIDPRVARMVIAARDFACLPDILIIASALSVQDARERPMDKQAAADSAHDEFKDPTSDFLTLIKLWNWFQEQQRHLSENKLRHFCASKFLSFTRMREWQDIHSQLKEMTATLSAVSNLQSPISNPPSQISNPKSPLLPDLIHQSILTGLIANIGLKGDDFEYQGIRSKRFYIFPGSTQFARKPQWIVAAELVQTTRNYARTVAPVMPEWIERAAAHMVHREYTDPIWQSRRGQVTAHEKVTLHGLTLIPRRTIDYSLIDPLTSRELFIHGALVMGDADRSMIDAPFFRQNLQLRRHIESLEARQRRKDLLADSKSIFAFYDRLIPASVVSAHTFQKWRHHAELSNRRILWMKESDLLIGDARLITEKLFPSTLQVEDLRLQLEYRFDVGHPADGITLRVPVNILHQVDAAQLEWLVPGMVKEKVLQLIRTLPKELRTQLVPLAQSAQQIADRMTFGEGRFIDVLAHETGRLVGKPISPKLLKESALEPWLKMNIRVVDTSGKTLAAGRRLDLLLSQLRIEARSSLQRRAAQWHKDNLKTWDFGDLPEQISFRSGPLNVQGYPALSDNGVTASMRLMEHRLLAQQETRKGIRRLAMIALADALQWQFKILPDLDALIPLYKPLGTKDQLRSTFSVALTDRLMFADPKPIRSQAEFELRLDNAWNNLRPTAEHLAKIAQEVFEVHNDIASRLSRDFPPMLLTSVSEMRDHLLRLCPSNVLVIHPWEWLLHVPRFLSGIRIRLHKLTNAGLLKDAHNSALIAPIWKAYQDRKKAAETAGVPDPELPQFRYLIEELRVSLFAQELKTSVPVSLSKLQKHFDAA